MEAELNRNGQTIIPTPTWVLVVRACQILFSIISLGLSGWWIHGLYANPLGFAIVCSIFTWIVCAYQLVAEKLPAARNLYNAWAVLALDGLMIVFWLAAMGALAAYRGRFTVPVSVAGCYSDGSAVNSNTCSVLYKRAGVAGHTALNGLSGNAAVCAIVMLLFVASFAYVAHAFRLALAAGRPAVDPEKPAPAAGAAAAAAAAGPAGPGVDPTQSNPLLSQQQQQQYPGQPQPQMYAQQQQQQQPAGYAQQELPAQYVQNQPYDPYVQQNTAYAGSGPIYMPDQTQYQHQQHQQHQQPQQPVYSPQGTPAPGQPYQLPAQ
ncbi:hypothetical protein SLS62_006289 [Diatrype stigma]|uniref:MARVEL domain-containing protein n=1 Tax=Diatrype stigma TaxID=117547 RepID=A0AAN9YMX0_9PEZI